jgi:hypothetical protein
MSILFFSNGNLIRFTLKYRFLSSGMSAVTLPSIFDTLGGAS